MKRLTRWIFGSIALPAFFAAANAQDAVAWRADIDFIVKQVQSLHPNPWHRVSRDEFLNQAEKLKKEIPGLGEDEIITRSMQLVAFLQDGHTQLTPSNHPLLTTWFPLRLDKFDDGLFITGIDKRYAGFVGSKVLRLGKVEAEEGFDLVGTVTPHDSRQGLPRVVPTYITNAAILKGLNIIQDKRFLPLEVVLPAGAKAALTLPSVDWKFDRGWTRNRTIVPGGGECVTVFTPRMDRLPLHLKKVLTTRDKYWYEFLPEHQAVYLQFNSVTNAKEPFDQFVGRLWAFCDEHAAGIDKFVMDLRYNEGGDGKLFRPLLHAFIKHERINRRGKLFIITGRSTFSAACRLIGQMAEHTEAITVGEPAGPVNWFSDVEQMATPSDRFVLDVATMSWQAGHALDARGYFPPEYPVLVTSADYFSGRDKALEKILSGEAVPLPDVLRTKGAEAFAAEYARWAEAFAAHDWWFPYTAFDIRSIGFDLARSGKKSEAVSLFRLNTVLHPKIDWTWENLGSVYESLGNTEQALKCLSQALEVHPDDYGIRSYYRNLSQKKK